MFFKRERTPIEIVLYGIYIYLRSNSFRKASEILKPLTNRSHESIRNWYYRFNNISRIINKNIKSRIALIDETFFQIGEKEAILWIAFELNKRIFLDFQITIGRGSLNSLQAEKFIKMLKDKHGVKIVYTDNASYYHLACKWAKLNIE